MPLAWAMFSALGLLRMARRLDEEQTAVYASILDVSFSLRRELLSQICRMLILDVFDDRVPAMNL